MGALPPNISGQTPQQLGDLFARNLRLASQNQISLIVAGSNEPTSDQGPWWKDNKTWRRWSTETGSYVPQFLEQESLGYIASSTEPDPDVYQLWIVLNESGQAQGARYYYNGAWVDIYSGVAYTQEESQAAIAEAIKAYPFRAQKSTNQSIVFASSGSQTVQVTLDNEIFDEDDVFGSNVFTAPVTGVYEIAFSVQLEIPSGTPTGMSVYPSLLRNGVAYDGAMYSSSSDTGGRIYGTSSLVFLNANDQIGLGIQITITGGSGTFQLTANSNTRLTGSLRQKS